MSRAGRISRQDKMNLLLDALDKGPASGKRLMSRTGLTTGQFKAAWQAVKQDAAPAMGMIAVYDPETGKYGMWPASRPAYNGSLNRIGDILTRLLTIDSGSIQGLVAQGVITKRLGRSLEIAKDEYEDRAGFINAELEKLGADGS